MGRVSKRHLNEGLKDRLLFVFFEHLARLQTQKSIQEFLQSILSPTENIMIAKRLAIAILLSRGYTYDRIDRTLKVSKSTIAIIDRQIASGAIGFKQATASIKGRKQTSDLWDSLEDVFNQVLLSTRVGIQKSHLTSEIQKNLKKRMKEEVI